MTALAYRLRVHAFECVMTFIWFTVLPINRWADAIRRGRPEFTYEISLYQYYYLPLVGVFKFALAVALGYWAGHLWHPIFGAFLGVAAYIGVSGAIHIDGLMDTFDALYAWPQERKWEVMKDPHVGGIGLAAFVIYLLFFVPIFIYNLTWALGRHDWIPVLILGVSAILPRMNCIPLLDYLPREDAHLQLRPSYAHWPDTRKMTADPAYILWSIPIALLIFVTHSWYLPAACLTVLAFNKFWMPKVLNNLGFIAGDVFGWQICVLELLLHTLYLLMLVRG